MILCKPHKPDGFHLFPRYLEPLSVGERTHQKWWVRRDFEITSQCRLVWDGLRFSPRAHKKKNRISITHRKPIAGFDPNLSPFLAGYSSQGIFMLHRDPKLVEKYRQRIGKLQQLRKKTHIKQQKLHRKITNWTNDLHWRSIGYLEKNYSGVLLPCFDTQELRRKTRSKALQKSYSLLSHYRFRPRLLERRNGLSVYVVYTVTSKTCSHCGTIDWFLGAKKVLHVVGKEIEISMRREYLDQISSYRKRSRL